MHFNNEDDGWIDCSSVQFYAYKYGIDTNAMHTKISSVSHVHVCQ